MAVGSQMVSALVLIDKRGNFLETLSQLRCVLGYILGSLYYFTRVTLDHLTLKADAKPKEDFCNIKYIQV